MKIAVFLPSLRGGGAEKVFLRLASEFAERKHQVDLVLAASEGPYLADVPDNVNIIDLRATRVLAAVPGLMRYLRRARPDVLLSAMDHSNVVAIVAGRLSRTPARIVVSVRSTLSERTRHAAGKGRLLLHAARWCYRWADQIVAVSRGAADDLVMSIRGVREKVCVIHNPVDTQALALLASEPLEHPFFAAGAPPVVLSVGRLTAAKDYPTLLRAFSQVLRKRSARLLILGEGETRPELDALLRELGIEDKVSMPGFVSNPWTYMSRAAVFALSSAWEGLPNALLEALACGTPVVSTDCRSGPAEILDGGRLGMLVPVGDAGALAAAIDATLDNPPDRDRLRSRADDFSVERIVDDYLDVLGRGQ